MKRADIKFGMEAWFCRNSARVAVRVLGPAQGPFFRVRYWDGAERDDVLACDLEPRKRPSALRAALRDVVREYEAAGGVVKAGEFQRMKKAEGER
jgi:hypothetical protein